MACPCHLSIHHMMGQTNSRGSYRQPQRPLTSPEIPSTSRNATSSAPTSSMITGIVRNVNEAGLQEVLSGNRLVVIDFFAPWCGPCRMLAPKLDQLAKDHQDVAFVKVDVDQCEEASMRFNVSALPTLVAIRNGQVVGRVVGASEIDIQQMVRSNCR